MIDMGGWVSEQEAAKARALPLSERVEAAKRVVEGLLAGPKPEENAQSEVMGFPGGVALLYRAGQELNLQMNVREVDDDLLGLLEEHYRDRYPVSGSTRGHRVFFVDGIPPKHVLLTDAKVAAARLLSQEGRVAAAVAVIAAVLKQEPPRKLYERTYPLEFPGGLVSLYWLPEGMTIMLDTRKEDDAVLDAIIEAIARHRGASASVVVSPPGYRLILV